MDSDVLDLPGDDKDFIVEHLVEGYEPDEIKYLLQEERGSHIGEETIRKYAGTDEADNAIDMRRRIQERKAEVSREELVADLKEAKEGLKSEIQELREANHNDISNDTMSNLISNIKLLGEFIGELQDKDQSSSGTVNVNKLEQNINISKSIQYLPASEKKDLATELANDPDVEDYVVVKNEE